MHPDYKSGRLDLQNNKHKNEIAYLFLNPSLAWYLCK